MTERSLAEQVRQRADVLGDSDWPFADVRLFHRAADALDAADALARAAASSLEGYMNRCPDKNANDPDIRAEHRAGSCRYCRLEAALSTYQKTREADR